MPTLLELAHLHPLDIKWDGDGKDEEEQLDCKRGSWTRSNLADLL
jgi:hypothetical protein